VSRVAGQVQGKNGQEPEKRKKKKKKEKGAATKKKGPRRQPTGAG